MSVQHQRSFYSGAVIIMNLVMVFTVLFQYNEAKAGLFLIENAVTENDRLKNANYIINSLCGNYIINHLVDNKVTKSEGFTEEGFNYKLYYNDRASVYWSGDWKKQKEPPRGSWLVREVIVSDLDYFYPTQKIKNMSRLNLERMFGSDKDKTNKNSFYAYGESAIIHFYLNNDRLNKITVDCRGSAF